MLESPYISSPVFSLPQTLRSTTYTLLRRYLNHLISNILVVEMMMTNASQGSPTPYRRGGSRRTRNGGR
jgi:hypothetical protein